MRAAEGRGTAIRPAGRRLRVVQPPSADEIEEHLLGPWMGATRPVALAVVGIIQRCSGFHYEADFERPLDASAAPLLFASNHCSHADTGAITGTLPRTLRERTLVAAAMDVFGAAPNGGAGRLARPLVQLAVGSAFHAFAFDRLGHSIRSVRASIRLVSRGWSLLVYPEGTRSRTGKLGRFKPGIGLLARATGRPVVPVHVEGSLRVLPCGTRWPRRGTIRVRYGAPIHCGVHEPPALFADRVRESVKDLGGIVEPEPRTSG